ncbi:hypothetical protein VNI00_017720 [Paramarasmius palmivorus]|uniref:Uncharacterized protein n=1 Tax=Paramarasmius palmivorus TaxID=297713 RepID=A0AAW0B4R2_9AGAR
MGTIAKGEATSYEALQVFVHAALPLLPLAYPERHFFAPVCDRIAVMPVALEYKQPFGDASMQSPTSRGEQEQQKDGTPRSGSEFGVNHARGPSRVDLAGSTIDPLHPVPRTNGTTPESELIQLPTAAEPQSLTGISAVSEIQLRDEIHPNHAVVLGRRRTHDRFDDGVLSATSLLYPVVHATSSLLFDVRPMHNTTLPDAMSIPTEWRDRVTGDGYLLVAPSRRTRSYWPCFYDSVIADMVAFLLDRSNSYQSRHSHPVFFHRLTRSTGSSGIDSKLLDALCGGETCGLKHITPEQYLRLDQEDRLHELVGLYHVLVTNEGDTGHGITKKELGYIGSYSSTRSVIDYSLSMLGSLSAHDFAKTSFMDFLEKAHATAFEGRVMCFPRIPHPFSTDVSFSLSTSAFSRVYSLGDPEIDSLFDLSGELDWHFVASPNACHFSPVASMGLNTAITIKEGALLLFIGMSTDEGIRLVAPGRFVLSSSHLLDEEDVAGVLLLAGDRMIMRPGSPYCVFTLEPTILRGSNFYCAATMERTYWDASSHSAPLARRHCEITRSIYG